ncbi:hypothetical protein VN12_17980 [Pirellula sp. SH-Sr6A]|uniref:hypothetical protein n=1 Tax=Pirellula sp. SH-Sr6A TaxID=1632865 RepID=UPI00078E9231|nr:hypothetical protein [Pirellula sp. SH-Sr6A]AMV34024.1 hypothetical protein VN12_17980 [Pirellula sp. SH-Sr6A]
MNANFFEQLQKLHLESGPLATAKRLVDEMRLQKRYPELFEALKMYHRVELGLPAVQTDPTGNGSNTNLLGDPVQDQLDKRLIESCKEVGAALLSQGALQEGWMYMRAVGDREAAAEALEGVDATQENLDMLLALLVQEGVDVQRGTRLSLSMRGTCNTITMMDSVIAMRGRADQQAAVGVLVEHVHQELLESVRADLQRRENWTADHPDARELSLEKLLASRPGLLKDGTYHLDTTHLASTIRFARILDDERSLRLALDIAQYGRQLHAQYQYPSDEPFADLYPMSIALFKALLGEQLEGAVRMFLQKAESLDPQEHGTVAIETYADLLTRIGRPAEAMQFLIKRMPRGMRPYGIAPSLIELAELSGEYQTMMNHARERLDDFGFAAALLQQSTAKCPVT